MLAGDTTFAGAVRTAACAGATAEGLSAISISGETEDLGKVGDDKCVFANGLMQPLVSTAMAAHDKVIRSAFFQFIFPSCEPVAGLRGTVLSAIFLIASS